MEAEYFDLNNYLYNLRHGSGLFQVYDSMAVFGIWNHMTLVVTEAPTIPLFIPPPPTLTQTTVQKRIQIASSGSLFGWGWGACRVDPSGSLTIWFRNKGLRLRAWDIRFRGPEFSVWGSGIQAEVLAYQFLAIFSDLSEGT